MGLDNGIIVKGVIRKQLPFGIHYIFDKDYNNEVEICYWRKWWPLRNIIVRELAGKAGENAYEFELTIKDLKWIKKLVRFYFFHPEEATQGYWENKIIRRNAVRNWWNLLLIIKWRRFHPDAKIFFYDSY